MGRGTRAPGVRVRRSPHLVAYWRDRTLITSNYATGTKVEVPPKACELLNLCGEWTTLEHLERAGVVHPSTLAGIVDRLVALQLLERSDHPRDPRVSAMERLRAWNPQAGFFHTTTKDVPFVSPRVAARKARAGHRRHVHPPPSSATQSTPRSTCGRLTATTPWPGFSSRGVPGAGIRLLRSRWMSWRPSLALTAGVQQWVAG